MRKVIQRHLNFEPLIVAAGYADCFPWTVSVGRCTTTHRCFYGIVVPENATISQAIGEVFDYFAYLFGHTARFVDSKAVNLARNTLVASIPNSEGSRKVGEDLRGFQFWVGIAYSFAEGVMKSGEKENWFGS